MVTEGISKPGLHYHSRRAKILHRSEKPFPIRVRNEPDDGDHDSQDPGKHPWEPRRGVRLLPLIDQRAGDRVIEILRRPDSELIRPTGKPLHRHITPRGVVMEGINSPVTIGIEQEPTFTNEINIDVHGPYRGRRRHGSIRGYC